MKEKEQTAEEEIKQITEWEHDENGKLRPVIRIYKVKDKGDSQVLTKIDERKWDPKIDK